ncbi:MAG: two-component system response regulator CreB [Gammaproteobacteria bacterium]|nr:two-component system response regulator CreB [Gammaproteobacteria bacterium]
MDQPRILIVEDEKAIADTLLFALSSEHYQPAWVSSGEQAVSSCETEHYDCVILDVGLPDINGFDVLKRIRQYSDVPVLFLTARSDEIDRILGLEMGADDYITKPFSPREVVTRVKVVLRRTVRHLEKPTPTLSKENNHSQSFIIDESQATVQLHDQSLALTRAEYLLLKVLVSQPQRVFTRAQLISAVWDENHPSDERAIDTHIKTLRAKLRDVDAQKTYIHTHRGIGYSLRV